MSLQLEIVSDHKEIYWAMITSACSVKTVGPSAARSKTTGSCRIPTDLFPVAMRPSTSRAGAYYLADVSSNGVYVNDESEPLGKGNPRRLFNGDRLRMGDFEFIVSLDEGEDLEMPPPTPATVVPDHIEQLVDEDSLKSGIQLLDEEAITGDEEFQEALFGSGAKKKVDEDSEKIDRAPNPVRRC